VCVLCFYNPIAVEILYECCSLQAIWKLIFSVKENDKALPSKRVSISFGEEAIVSFNDFNIHCKSFFLSAAEENRCRLKISWPYDKRTMKTEIISTCCVSEPEIVAVQASEFKPIPSIHAPSLSKKEEFALVLTVISHYPEEKMETLKQLEQPTIKDCLCYRESSEKAGNSEYIDSFEDASVYSDEITISTQYIVSHTLDERSKTMTDAPKPADATHLTLVNRIPQYLADSVKFWIISGTQAEAVSVPGNEGSAKVPTQAEDKKWEVFCELNSKISAVVTVCDPNATLACGVGGAWTVSLAAAPSHSPAGAKPSPILDQPDYWGSSPATPLVHITLNFVMQQQTQTQWCWAAVTSSVADYYNSHQMTQCALANWAFAQTTCCTNGNSPACNKPYPLQAPLQQVQHLNQATLGGLSFPQIKTEINNSHPIAIGVAWSGGGGHALAIAGYDDANNTIDLRDPWYGSSVAAFNGFPANYHSSTWHSSYTTQ
jgi:hypothetical protein